MAKEGKGTVMPKGVPGEAPLSGGGTAVNRREAEKGTFGTSSSGNSVKK